MSHVTPSSLKPTCSCICRRVSSQRNTPANLPLNGTTALLNTLLAVGNGSRGMMGFITSRHTTPAWPTGRSCQGMLGSASPTSVVPLPPPVGLMRGDDTGRTVGLGFIGTTLVRKVPGSDSRLVGGGRSAAAPMRPRPGRGRADRFLRQRSIGLRAARDPGYRAGAAGAGR
jgi:hypothetical protein